MIQDALFDVEELAREAIAATAWAGPCPLAYTTDFHVPADLDAAAARYQNDHGSFGWVPRSHMWHRAVTSPPLILDAHQLHVYVADARCEDQDHDHGADGLPDELMYQAICPGCRWHRISADERHVIEAWHDHALPGWRELPVIPAKLVKARHAATGEQKVTRWVKEHYPSDWQRPGHPVVTDRGDGVRPVAGRSPFGGYDLASTK